MLPAPDCKVLQRDLLGCAAVAPICRPARSVSLVLLVTSDPAVAGRGRAVLSPGGRRLLQRDPGAGPGAAWAAGRCEPQMCPRGSR
ncbi:Atp Synthase Mitochondrial F1 Complex Assembly Factor 2 [Manis pentadactyla]|nr:Atp Synthase Mitochondrial F1 Complex Assembly Factor 2 [Manis pentadactyla]